MESTNNDAASIVTVTPKSKRERRTWPAQLSIRMCREVLFLRPYHHAPRSVERTQTWDTIYDNLSALTEFNECAFTLKAIKDHLSGICDKRKAQVKKEANETGLGEERGRTELQQLVDELNEDMEKEAELQEVHNEEKRNADDKEKEKALDMRQKAMESLGDTRKRNRDSGDMETTPPSTKRRSGSETLTYLQEKTEALRKSDEEKARLKKEELALRKQEVDNMQSSWQTMSANMQTSQQQMMQLFATQQQQTMQQQQQMQLQMQQQMLEGMKQIAQMFAPSNNKTNNK